MLFVRQGACTLCRLKHDWAIGDEHDVWRAARTVVARTAGGEPHVHRRCMRCGWGAAQALLLRVLRVGSRTGTVVACAAGGEPHRHRRCMRCGWGAAQALLLRVLR
eukprot:353459-Chlamydomonas_euryale.AAC.1